jgi:hypothetical protein
MVLAAHQPNYLPWTGFFHKMARCDVFVLLDSVQYARRSYTARCLVKGAAGGKQWLSVPVYKTGRYHQSVAEVEVDNQEPWQQRHRRTLESLYAKAPHFRDQQWLLDLAYGRPWDNLCDMNMALIKALAGRLDVKPSIVRSSELWVKASSAGLLAGICTAIGADTYRSGPSGEDYLDPDIFKQAGVALKIARFTPRPYRQSGGDFVPGLSLIDLLFNCGTTAAMREVSREP